MTTKSKNRSAVSNGSKLLSGSWDGRSRFARRYRDLTQDMASDLGGAAALSTLQQQLIRRAAMLSARCEDCEAALAAGGNVNDERLASDIALLTRIARQLGLQRVARDVTGALDLKTYLAAKKAAAPAPETDDEDDEPETITIEPAGTDAAADDAALLQINPATLDQAAPASTISPAQGAPLVQVDGIGGAGEAARVEARVGRDAGSAAGTRASKRSDAIEVHELARLARTENKTFAELLAERKRG